MKSFLDTVREASLHAIMLVSPVHEDAHLRGIAEAYRRRLESIGVSSIHVVRDVKEAEEAASKARLADGLVMVFLSGGTSKIAQEVYAATRIPPLLVAHEYHNASASMMSAQSRIRFEAGGRVAGWVVAGPDSPKLTQSVAAYRAAAALKRLHVVQVDADKPSKDAIAFQERIGGKVTLVSTEETNRMLEEGRREASKYLTELEAVDLGGVKEELLRESLAVLAMALKAVERFSANAFTVDCFPFIMRYRVTPCVALSRLLDHGYVAACEADYRALTLLALSFGLASMPGWIGNFNVLVGGRELRLSHCTVATRLTRYATLLPHFETGNPYAVAGQMREGDYTVTAVSPDYTVLWYAEGSLRVSGTLTGGKCRTQAILDLTEDVDESTIVSNHHVLIPGRHGASLRIVAGYLGMKLVSGGGREWF